MSTVVNNSDHAHSSRPWWSLSNKSPSSLNASRDSKASSSKFNTFASVLGIKPKRHPTLTIQEPPSPIRTASSPSNISDAARFRTYSTRPPSKSVSSTRSPVESIEPATPVDEHHNHHHSLPARQSLLTLSDLDPFAAHNIVIAPNGPDPSRLSAYSHSSADNHWKKTRPLMPARSSYASSYFSNGEPSSPSQPPTPPRKLTTRRSHGSLTRKPSLVASDSSLSSAWESLTHNALLGCTSMSADKNRRSQPPPDPLPRPPMRARRLTESGTRLPSAFIAGDSKPSSLSPSPPESSTRRPSPASPSPIRRKPSANRVGLPPSAPPTHELPLPPAPKHSSLGVLPDDDSDILPDISNSSTSSSSLSFASSLSSNRDDAHHDLFSSPKSEKHLHRLALPDRRNVDLDKLFDSPPMQDSSASPSHSRHVPFSSPQTLKKALSSQSLGKKRSSTSSTASGPPDVSHEKAPRKQRSYPRIPVPPLPSLRHTASVGAALDIANSPTTTQRTSSSSGLPAGRSRLFSATSSKRPSTSQCTPGEVDARSAFSLPLEHERLQSLSLSSSGASCATSPAHLTSPLHPPGNHVSLWDDSFDEPGSPSGMSEFSGSRRILSPADMLKVEASVHSFEEPFLRSRTLSFTSVSTVLSEKDDLASPATLSPPASLMVLPVLAPHTGSPVQTTSTVRKSLSSTRLRPSTSQATMTPPSTPSSPISPANSNGQSWPLPASRMVPTGLPPPPRPRAGRPTTAPHYSATGPSGASQPTVTSPLASQPPLTQPGSVVLPVFPLSPPPPRKRSAHAIVASERVVQRQSILKKPSFLDIWDDTDREEEARTDSFLDLARESFDTVRT